MPVEITLTTFTDFVVASTTASKVGVVRKAKETYGAEYEPAHDYWRRLRKAIQEMHSTGRPLDTTINGAAPRKVTNYREVADAYRRWIRNKRIEPIVRPPKAAWRYEDLKMRLNPESFLRINGTPYAIKLYFGKQALSKNRTNTILYLLDWGFGSHGLAVAVHDVRRGSLIVQGMPNPTMEVYVVGEAASFLAMWRQLEGPPPQLRVAGT